MNSHLDRLRLEIEDAVSGVSPVQLAKAPAEKWSAAQILEHLLLTYKGTNRGLSKCLETGHPLAKQPGLMTRTAKFLVVSLGYMPGGRKAPERAVPRGMQPEEVRRVIIPELQTMADALDECERRFGFRTQIMDHLFLGPLTAEEWRKFHWVHGRHHTRQIRERLRKV